MRWWIPANGETTPYDHTKNLTRTIRARQQMIAPTRNCQLKRDSDFVIPAYGVSDVSKIFCKMSVPNNTTCCFILICSQAIKIFYNILETCRNWTTLLIEIIFLQTRITSWRQRNVIMKITSLTKTWGFGMASHTKISYYVGMLWCSELVVTRYPITQYEINKA